MGKVLSTIKPASLVDLLPLHKNKNKYFKFGSLNLGSAAVNCFRDICNRSYSWATLAPATNLPIYFYCFSFIFPDLGSVRVYTAH